MAPRLPRAHPTCDACSQTASRRVHLALGTALVAATFAAHFPAVHAGYIWDDDYLLYENPLILNADGLHEIWLSKESPDYWPLTATTFWLEWRIWGNNPKPYHVTNIALHAAAAVLLWRVLRRLHVSEGAAILAGLIFAVHPVTVASVAWISERKNVLSIGLYLLAILAFLQFEDRSTRRWYVLALFAAAAALLAKASVVMLPFVLLLCGWWRRGRLTRRDVLRAMPFFALSLALGLVTVWFQRHNVISGVVVRPEGPASRIAASGWIVWFYLYKILLPINLSMIYPRWEVDGERVVSFLPLVLLIVSVAVLWHFRKTWARGPLAASVYFLITLLPVLGFVNMSFAKCSLVADHLQYLAIPGVIALLAGLLSAFVARCRQSSSAALRATGPAAICAVILVPGALTWRQAQVYKDGESLWTHTIRLNDRAWVAYNNRGNARDEKGAYDRAIQDYSRAIELRPDYAEAYNNRGTSYNGKGDRDRAVQDFTKAIELEPAYAKAYFNRGIARGEKGDYDQAIQDYNRTIELKPNDAEAYNNRGLAHAGKGAYDRAIQDYNKAIQLKPNYADAYYNRGVAHGGKGAYDRAIQDYNRAIDLKPNDAEAYYNRGVAHGQIGAHDRAIQDYNRAIELKPNYAMAYNNRAVSLYQLKQFDRAWADVKRCRQLGGTPHPGFVRALSEATGRSE